MLATKIIFITLCFSFYASCHGMFTPLEIDNHPCQPENLKVNANRRVHALSYGVKFNGEIDIVQYIFTLNKITFL